VIELTEVRVVPISAVDDEYARAEGRGYADAAEWRRAHEDFFRSEGIAEFLGATPVIDDGTLVVTERFRVSYPWTRLNCWAPVLLQVYCWSCTPLLVEEPGVSMHSPELSATKL
jgi:hypothetical protein